jgi:hypothetical protein
MDYKIIFSLFSIILLSTITGWEINELWRSYNLDKQYEGLWIPNVNQTEAKEITNYYDDYGNWICVNIEGMDYKRAVEVCSHETGHEIFAGICEKNMSKCEGIMK